MPRTRPRSTHTLNNACFSLAPTTTLVAPLTPAQQHERSQSVPPFSTLPRTPPRVLASAAGQQKGTRGLVNGADRYSVTGIGAASPPSKAMGLEKEEKSASSLSSDDSVGGASSSRRLSLHSGKDKLGADSSSLGSGESKYSTHYWNSDSISEPGSLGGLLTKKDIASLTRSTTPPPKPPPPKSVHSDMYNTMFALHSLNQTDGWSEYLTTVRGMLDSHMTKRSSTSHSNGGGGGTSSNGGAAPAGSV